MRILSKKKILLKNNSKKLTLQEKNYKKTLKKQLKESMKKKIKTLSISKS